MVCGHRWMNISESKLIPGACYSFQPNENLKRISNILSPTASVERSKRFLLDQSSGLPVDKQKILTFKYALSQLGMSVHFLESDKEKNGLIFGAPGFLNWKGTVVQCNDLSMCTSTPTIIDTYIRREIEDFDLFGYQVASGYFFSPDELTYVAGAPRDRSMKGYVLLYKLSKHEAHLKNVLKINGKTTGEYFGSSIAVADITGDGLDDLVVGAPFYSKNGDEGCVYVLEFHKSTRTLKKMDRIEGMKETGRFGTSVASIGDLDHDGFSDIAVGAPYDDNGVIYIYYGRSSGLKGSYQRITAASLHKSLRGFGISFSGRVDIDNNHHYDIAVGSFLSGHAVILRTRPVVTITAKIHPVTHKLSDSVSQAQIKVCVNFVGKNVSQLNVTRKISADLSYGRAIPPFIQDTALLKHNDYKCDIYTFNVKFNSKLIHQSMEFQVSASVTNTSKSAIPVKQPHFVNEHGVLEFDGFHQDPIQRTASTSEDLLKMPYSQDCVEEICHPDLQLTCFLLVNGYISSQPFILGSLEENYQLEIDVKNLGEPSYSTLVEIKFSPDIQLASMPYLCNYVEQTIHCQLGIIRNNSDARIVIDLDMSSIEQIGTNDEYTYINVSINSTASDLNLGNNFKQIIINSSLDVDAHIYGKSHDDNYVVSKLDNGSYTSFLEVAQIYEVHKKGISPLKMFELNLQIPVNITNGKEEIQVLTIHKPEAIIDGKYWFCSVDFGCSDCQSTASREIEDIESTSSVRSKRSLIDDISFKDKTPPTNRTFYINCSNEFVKCTTVRCQTTELEAYGKITLRLEVNIGNLGPLMGLKDIVYITSSGEIKLINPDISEVKNIQPKWPHTAEASSTIIGKIPKKKVDLWIIVASVIGGILLAMVVAMGLAKAGFFRRQTKEDLAELKEKTRYSQIQPELMSDLDEDVNDGIELR